MHAARWTMTDVNAWDRDTFVAHLGFLFEHSPWIAGAAWADRPFARRADLQRALSEAVRRSGEERQVALIQAHPDLVGRAALAGTLTRESTGEQQAAGLDPGRLTPEEIARFGQLNQAYRTRFGFPFVICARDNTKASILAGFAARLNNNRTDEIAAALAEIAKICWYRLTDVVDETADSRGRTAEKENPLPTSGAMMPAYDYSIGYGKRRVPVYRVRAAPLTGIRPIPESQFAGRANGLFALEVDVEVLSGDFLAAYTRGDNAGLVATDSMKNFILRRALDFEGATLEGFLSFVGHGFLATYPQIRSLRLTGREMPFVAAPVPAGTADGAFAPSEVLFDRVDTDYAAAMIELAMDDGGGAVVTGHRCSRVGMRLMKTTGSAFTSFLRDGYTTLPERRDRPLYITLDVDWHYADVTDLLQDNPARYVPAEQVRDLLRTVFHRFVSESIQHLVHEFGLRLLDRFPQLDEIRFRAENRTRDPYGESSTDPRVRVFSDPFSAYGEITLTVRRRR